MADYSHFTKKELIAEIERLNKFKSLLVSAIIRHYRKQKDDSNDC